jgi:hypothetical protein
MKAGRYYVRKGFISSEFAAALRWRFWGNAE